jgi:hypothetical protein
LQLLTDSENGDKNYEQVHLHPLDIDLLQRSRHSLGATRPRRRRSQDARPPIAPIKIKLRMPAATTSSIQPQPLKQSRGSSLSAVLAEIIREPLKKRPEEADTTTTLSVWTASLKPAVVHPVVQGADEKTPNRRGLVETVASIREFYSTEFCHQLVKEIAAEAILEAEIHRQEEVDRDLKGDGSFGPSQSELGPEFLDAATAIPACLSSGLSDRAEEEPLHEKREGVETPCYPGTADEEVMNNTDEAKSSTGHSLDSALLEENQTLLSKGVVDSSAEPPIVVKIAKIRMHPPESGTSSNKAALPESPPRALRSSAPSQDSGATAEMTGQSKHEGSLKVVISPSKQTVLPPTKDSKTILLKVKGRKLALEKGQVVSKGRKKLHSSIRKRNAPRGRRRVRQRGKEKEPVTEEVVPEKVSYVTVLKMSEIVSMRPAAAAGCGAGRGKIIQKLNSTMDSSGLNRFQETKSIAETATEETVECGLALNAGKGETLLEKLPESEPSPTPEGGKAQPEAPELQRPEVPHLQQQTPEVPQQPGPEVPKQPQPQEVSQLDSGCLPELEDEFIQDLPVLSYPPVPLPLSSSGLLPGTTIPVVVEAKSGEISVGPLQSNKKKKKKKAKKSPSPPPSKAQQLPVMRKSQAEIILAKIPPTAPAPLPSSRRGSTSGSGQKNREHWVTSPPPAAAQPDFVARKSRPDETVTFCLPEGGFLRAPPPTPLYRRVDELFGQYFPPETTTLEESVDTTVSTLVGDVLSDLVETVCRVAQRSGNRRVITAAPHQEWRSEESRPEEGNTEMESRAGRQPDGESNNSTQCGQEAVRGSKQENLPALGDSENKKIHESKSGNSDSQKGSVAELPVATEELPAPPACAETNGGAVRRIRKSSSLSESNTTEETAAQARRNRMKHTG